MTAYIFITMAVVMVIFTYSERSFSFFMWKDDSDMPEIMEIMYLKQIFSLLYYEL